MTFEQLYKSSPLIQKQPIDYFRLIPQECIKQIYVDGEPDNQGIWDMNIRRSDGRIFFSVCAEMIVPGYPRLYEYIPGEASIKRLFQLEKEIIQQDRSIRPSKIHTSLQFMDDGRLVMQTHTTSPSPRHPYWLPESYLNHQWEGFRGSELIIYEPRSGRLENKGILAPFCSLYGGAYSRCGNFYAGVGIFNGAGYLYDFKTNQVTEMGQITDGRTNRLYEGPDGHLYYGTATGHLARINADTRKAEILVKLEEPYSMRHGLFDKDGVFWFTTRVGKLLHSYNTKTGAYKVAGRFVPEDDKAEPAFHFCYGFDFDSKGCIWFCVNQFGNKNFHSLVYYRNGVRLYKWDLFGGGQPIDFGIIGIPGKQTVAICAEVFIHEDKLILTNGNHLEDPAGIIEINLTKMTEDKINSNRPLSTDPIDYICCEGGREQFPLGTEQYDGIVAKYMTYYEKTYKGVQIGEQNCSYAKFRSMTGVALWESMGYGNGSVHSLHWADDETLEGISGGTEKYTFKLNLNERGLFMEEFHLDNTVEIPSPLKAFVPEGVQLPYMPGRQYLAEAESSAELADGSVIVGTKDMMLCRIKDGKTYGLGAVTTSGGVHSLSVTPDGKTVYGVAGYECGKGDIFRYSCKDGLFWLGTVPITPTPTGRQLVSNRPWVCAVSPNGKFLAIGALDEMSGVGVYGL